MLSSDSAGRKLKKDVMGIYEDDKLTRFLMNGLFYGFLGDVVHRGEKLRFLGPSRFGVSGVQAFLADSSKRVECEYKGKDCDDSSGSKKSEIKCSRQCAKCADRGPGEGSGADVASERWTKISGKFLQISCTLHILQSPYSPQGLVPRAHIGDGYLDVMCVEDASKVNALRFLIMSRFFAEKKFDLPFVSLLRVKELRIKPEPKACGFYNCDGELVPAVPIHCKVFRQMLEVFTSGVEPVMPSARSYGSLESAYSRDRQLRPSFFSRFSAQWKKKYHVQNPIATSASMPVVDLSFADSGESNPVRAQHQRDLPVDLHP